MSIIKSRRRQSREFKLEAIQLVANREGNVTKVAESLGIHPNIIHRWIKEHEEDPSDSFPGNGKLRTTDDEIRQLKQQLREAEEERDILKKALAIFSKKALKYQFIRDQLQQFSLTRLCRLLAISRSAYYRWLTSKPSKWAQENAALLKEIKVIHHRSRQTYGSPRITQQLQHRGYWCSRARVARLMAKNNISAKTKRKFKVTTDSDHHYPVAPDLLNQNFNSDAPNKIWVSDITYIGTRAGWLYLTVILDLFNRQVVGWSLSHRLTAITTTIPALSDAFRRQRPDAGLIFHSDR